MWPTITALWIVSEGIPPYDLLLLFIVGTVLMRSAGCVINDIADRNIDSQVKRTFKRPLADGRLSVWTALVVFAVLAGLALLVVLQLNFKTQLLAFAGFGIAVLYPFHETSYDVAPISARTGVFMGYSAGFDCGPRFVGFPRRDLPAFYREFLLDRSVRHNLRHG